MQKDINKVVKLIVNITEAQKKMVERLSAKRGTTSLSETIRWVITEAYNNENKNI